VEPARQGEGIGNRLLSDAETVAHQQLGREQLLMRVLHQREELIGYYQRRGYRQTGETAPFPESQRFGNPLVDDLWFVVLEKTL
jgi:ribosomal protein S18 acetylase RimI-like enzyme